MKILNIEIRRAMKLAICTICIAFITEKIQAADPAEAKTIGRTIRERDDLSKFSQLIEKTELGSSLSERTNERRTVFAPTNAAFAKVSSKALKTLLDPRNKDRLDEVFNFHVLRGSIPSIGLEKYTTLMMSSNQFLSINFNKGTIGKARFTGKIIECSNGVIYLIDSILEPNTDDLFQKLQKDGRFTIFTKAITASRQGKLFQNMHGVYTAFAPTDEAFKKLPASLLESLFLPENNERLEDIIKHHIAFAARGIGYNSYFESFGLSGLSVSSEFGQEINFKRNKDIVTLDGAKVIEADIPCANGLIHVIDSVIPPVEFSLLDILKNDKRFSTLVDLLEKTGLSIPVASSNKFTIFAPTNEAFQKEPYASLIKDPNANNREVIYALLTRHVISGKHLSENCLPYTKQRTIVNGPIILTRSNSVSKINNIPIIETDIEAFNGFINAIGSVIEDSMELPEGDISTVDAINFVQQTLENASKLYKKADYEACWRYYTARGYEFLSKYRRFIGKDAAEKFTSIIRDDQTLFQFAAKTWSSRNIFRDTLRVLEQREERIQDSYLMLRPERARFGR